ncbi:hypothetical protein GYB62_02270 [bacterium]|nr:hypothetical protein [bacterium]
MSTIIDVPPLADERIAAMLMPLVGSYMLMPDVSVTEIARLGKIVVPSQSPEWFLGTIVWRGQEVPVVSFEALNGSLAPEVSEDSLVAVMSGMADNGHLPYYGVLIQGSPRVVDASDAVLQTNDLRPRGRAEAMSIKIDDAEGGIPNIEWIEQHLLAYTLNN